MYHLDFKFALENGLLLGPNIETIFKSILEFSHNRVFDFIQNRNMRHYRDETLLV